MFWWSPAWWSFGLLPLHISLLVLIQTDSTICYSFQVGAAGSISKFHPLSSLLYSSTPRWSCLLRLCPGFCEMSRCFINLWRCFKFGVSFLQSLSIFVLNIPNIIQLTEWQIIMHLIIYFQQSLIHYHPVSAAGTSHVGRRCLPASSLNWCAGQGSCFAMPSSGWLHRAGDLSLHWDIADL